MPGVRLISGNCTEVMVDLANEGVQVDTVITDAPYHLASIVSRLGNPDSAPIQSGATGVYARSSSGFMGQKWDGGDVAFRVDTWRKAYDLLKPGGHLIAFSHVRTYHRMACAIEDAGFEVRNMLDWIYGTGFPKSHNLEGEYDGWGTDLKPAKEPMCLARKPIIGSVAANMEMFGTGALNIDGCRIHADDAQGGAYTIRRLNPGASVNSSGKWKQDEIYEGEMKPGRWPTNIIHDGSDEVLDAFAAYGERGACAPASGPKHEGRSTSVAMGSFNGMGERPPAFHGDSGTAARFHYSTKATDAERIFRCRVCGAHGLGKLTCGHDPEQWDSHPTVKPVGLMRWLAKLVTPPGGLILDPFAGTGTTGAAAIAEGFNAILIEAEPDYQADIRVRLGDAITEQVSCRPVRQMAAGPLFEAAA